MLRIILLLMFSLGLEAVAQSEEDYTYLNALQGSSGGYCVVLEDNQGNVTELVTTEGGLSKGQIRKATRFASYRQMLVSGGLVSLGPAMIPLLRKSKGPKMMVAVALPAIFIGNQVRYIQKMTGDEQETSTASIVSMLSVVPPISFLTEEIIRINRASQIVDRRKKLRFSAGDSETDRSTLGIVKLDKIMARMKKLPAKYPGSCSHL